jgi:hypothetical protein
MRSRSHRAIAAAAAAAIALTSVALTPATAAPAAKQQAHQQTMGSSQATDFSARRRAPRNHAVDRAVLGAVAGLFGTIAVMAARDRYERRYRYGYYGNPYYGPPPYAYRHGPYYPY